MVRTKRRRPRRKRVGRASYYQRHSAWWIYYRDGARRWPDSRMVRRPGICVAEPSPNPATASTHQRGIQGEFLDFCGVKSPDY